MSSTAICYLGRRGAGLRIFRDLHEVVHEFDSEFRFVFISRDSNYIDCVKLDNHIQIPSYGNPMELIRFIMLLPITFYRLTKFLRKREVRKILFVMPSPADWFLQKISDYLKIKTFHTIHDAKTHLGEKWPNNKSIRWRIRSSYKVLCLSEFVAKQCKEIYTENNFVVTPHPSFLVKNLQPPVIDIPKDFILFIGRIKSYKGISWLIECFEKTNPKLTLVIAGEGSSELKVENSRILFLDKWFSDDEFDYLIQKSSLVILPYLEASQSGVLNLAMNLRKKIVATRVGGLIEQAEGYPHILWTSAGDSNSLIEIIKNFEVQSYPESVSPSNEILDQYKAIESYRNLLKAIC